MKCGTKEVEKAKIEVGISSPILAAAGAGGPMAWVDCHLKQ